MIAIDCSFRTEEGLIHFCAETNLSRANRISRHCLVDVREPSQTWGSSARARLSHAIRFERTSGVENDLVSLANSSNGLVGRFVVMLRVVTSRNGVGKIQLVSVEIPVADEAFG